MTEKERAGPDAANCEPRASRVWETPTIEEIDLTSTEAAYSGTGADLGIYHS